MQEVWAVDKWRSRTNPYCFGEMCMLPTAMAEGIGGESPCFYMLFFDSVNEGYILIVLSVQTLRFF